MESSFEGMNDRDLEEELTEALLVYMAEGGANVIFRIEWPSPNRQLLLLRVGKQMQASSLNSSQVMEAHERRIKALIPPKYLLQQRPIRLQRSVTDLLQILLVDAEETGLRPSSRSGEYLLPSGDEAGTRKLPNHHGILIQDLSPNVPSEYLLEFKPKWLVPSRTAPEDSMRCRTCALREMRRADGTSPGRGDSNCCPLDLLSGKSYILRLALRKLWTVEMLEDEPCTEDDIGPDSQDDDALKSSGEVMSVLNISGKRNGPLIESFEGEFRRKVQPLLGRLKALQALNCHVGLQDFNTGADDDVSLSMSLRDCSLFVKVEAKADKVEILDVKLADLDPKSTDRNKREKWMNMERRLIEEGWYQGEKAPGAVRDEVVCWVSRTCT